VTCKRCPLRTSGGRAVRPLHRALRAGSAGRGGPAAFALELHPERLGDGDEAGDTLGRSLVPIERRALRSRSRQGGYRPAVRADRVIRWTAAGPRHVDRVNIQRGKDAHAKAYQVRQVLDAIAKLEAENNEEDEESDDDA
jgi:hypothetical protein